MKNKKTIFGKVHLTLLSSNTKNKRKETFDHYDIRVKNMNRVTFDLVSETLRAKD